MKKLILILVLICISIRHTNAQQGLAEAIANKISQNFVIEIKHLPPDMEHNAIEALDHEVIDSVIHLLQSRGFEVQEGWLDGVYPHNCHYQRSRSNIISLSLNGEPLYAAILELGENIYQESYYIDVHYCEYRLVAKF